MAHEKSSRFLAQVEEVLPRENILIWARELGVIRRQRKLDIVTFVYSLVLGFGATRTRSPSAFRRLYMRISGAVLARSSFHGRFTEPLVHLLKQLLDGAVSASTERPTRLNGVASAFVEVLAIDSSVVRVSDEMAEDWPSVWSNHTKASVKIAAVTNVVGRNLKHVRFSPGSRHDVHLLESGPWLKSGLVVFDLGFFKMDLFNRNSRLEALSMMTRRWSTSSSHSSTCVARRDCKLSLSRATPRVARFPRNRSARSESKATVAS